MNVVGCSAKSIAHNVPQIGDVADLRSEKLKLKTKHNMKNKTQCKNENGNSANLLLATVTAPVFIFFVRLLSAVRKRVAVLREKLSRNKSLSADTKLSNGNESFLTTLKEAEKERIVQLTKSQPLSPMSALTG